MLLPFHSMYLCKAVFSALTIIKAKYQSTLKNIENGLCPAISNIWSQFSYLCKSEWTYISHQYANLLLSLGNGKIICVPKNCFRTGKVAQWLRALAALPKDLGRIRFQHAHGSSQQPVTPISKEPMPTSDFQGHQACTGNIDIHVDRTLICIKLIF